MRTGRWAFVAEVRVAQIGVRDLLGPRHGFLFLCEHSVLGKRMARDELPLYCSKSLLLPEQYLDCGVLLGQRSTFDFKLQTGQHCTCTL